MVISSTRGAMVRHIGTSVLHIIPCGNKGYRGFVGGCQDKPRGVYEVIEAQTEDAINGDTREGIFQIDERFELPDEITSSERLCLITNTNATQQVSDNEDEESEPGEFDVEEEEEADNDEDEVVYYNLLDLDQDDSDS
uniref:Uncharacterized protein n=1 Tax=Lactuca sativa TaxID=4236 RepID=A0A9R1XMA6_LACSA|nr:hypothetical protein LSAT_V11C300127360 [Lactuca sativa]